ncbi:MAG: SLC13 family permease, partial [Caulobacteraceae bacterium]
MNLQQILAFALLGGAIAVFIWGRFRDDLVALFTLLVGVLIGVVPAKDAFDGFSNDIVIIIASALVVSAAIGRSGVIEAGLRPILSRLNTPATQIPAMVAGVTLMSMVTKNVGALAIFMPIANQLAKRSGASVSCFLMPMSFGALLGGIVTMVGTSPNIIVAEVRQREMGQPFGMFDYTPVGLGLAIGGIVFLSFAYRLIPSGRKPAASVDEAMDAAPYVTEVRAPYTGPSGLTVTDLHALSDQSVRVVSILRRGEKEVKALPDTEIKGDDTLILQGEQQALDRLIASAQLKIDKPKAPVTMNDPDDEVRVVEAVIGARSILNGQSARSMGLQDRYGVNLVAVGRSDSRITERPRSVTLSPGDVVVLEGATRLMPGVLRDLGCLPLAERELRLGGIHRKLLPILILAGAMLLVAFGVLKVAVAFFLAALLVIAVGAITLRDAYRALDGPVLILIAALIPVSDALRVTGGTGLVAEWLAPWLGALPAVGAVFVMVLAAMAATPFLNNAATVLVMGPLAMSVAKDLHYNPDAFLMAVAVGAACDFLTPIGHQCNTLVMGPGGYRFGDYARLGAPLSLFVLI